MTLDLADYDFSLPEELVAKTPASPRDSARLMVVDTKAGKVCVDVFRNLHRYLPATSLMVLNRTKVVPARVTLYKETGGKVVALFLLNEPRGGTTTRALLDRGVARNASLYLSKVKRTHRFIVAGQEKNAFSLKPEFDIRHLPKLLEHYGTTPIPPYLRDTPLSERKLRERYQTVFAREAGSVAAPTASLHFTPRVFMALTNKGIERAFITLHVGLGTFAPIGAENFVSGKLHEERYEMSHHSLERISRAKREGRPVVAVGTTSVRTLETVAPEILANTYDRRYLLKAERRGVFGTADLFIYPPYEFKIADALITNFHVPRSSLMCLVDAFLEHKKSAVRIPELYRLAMKERMRFFSFGDAMLIV